MSDISKKTQAWTFILAVRRIKSRLQSGGLQSPPLELAMAARLAISFVAVGVLLVAATLLVESTSSVSQPSQTRRERVMPIERAAPAALPLAQVSSTDLRTSSADLRTSSAALRTSSADLRTSPPTVLAPPAPARPAFPSADPLRRAIDVVQRAADTGTAGDLTELMEAYQKVAAELDHAATDFASAARAAGEPPPVRFMVAVGSYRQAGADLIRLAALRRASMASYSSRLEQLDARLKKSPGRTHGIFGRVFARQSPIRVTNELDDLRRRYVEFSSADTIDSATSDALGASEAALAQSLTQGRAGFTHAEAQDWYTTSQDDLKAMSAARSALQQIDRQRKDDTRQFGNDAAALSQIVGQMEKSAAHLARRSGAPRPGKRSALPQSTFPTRAPAPDQKTAALASQSASLATPVAGTTALASQSASAAISVAGTSPSVDPPSVSGDLQVQRRIGVTAVAGQNHDRKAPLLWLSGGLVLLAIYISVATILSIVRPVRRLIGAAQSQHHLLENKVAERTVQLQELAQLDPLTRIANRRHFFTLLNAAIERATRETRLVGVFFLDIDNFKTMNDSLGHEFGDDVLQMIAKRLSESTHSFGFAARLGGDEFTVVYESAGSMEDIRVAGLQLLNAFQEPFPLNGRELVVSISAGASIFPDHATNAEALLRAADAALFQAKALGRSQLALFTPALLEAASARSTTEQGLRRALERGEFELVFQPEVNLQSCEVELVEALLRWRQPDGRYALPGEFLGVAETSGLILQINEWVLRRVVETAARWHHGHWPDVRVAMNVSSRQLFDNSFVEQVRSLLEEYKLPPRCIEIELTENVLQTGMATIASLRSLRAHGIAIALDDFGAGFSSLASLEQLPLTRIKLDRSLVASIDTSARSASIATAIIQLCQGLGLSVTAEGIERSEQLAPLMGYPAVYAQGFLLAQPQSVDELLPVIAKVPALTRALVRASLAHLTESELADNLPLVSAAIKH